MSTLSAHRSLTLASHSFNLKSAVSSLRCKICGATVVFMDKKRILVSLAVFLILAVLVYLQVREWQSFDWSRFSNLNREIRWSHVIHAIAWIYIGYVLRAIRWKLFLLPARPKARYAGLISSTLIGFSGLALLGRPGELIRPYLISKREGLPFSSQMGVWAIERIFDVGAFTLLMVLAIFFLPSAMQSIPHPEYYHEFRIGGFALMGLVIALGVGATVVGKGGERIAKWTEARFAHLAGNLGNRIAERIREFGAGLRFIHGPASLSLSVLVSILMWFVIAVAYQEVAHAYGAAALDISRPQVLLLMGASIFGSMLQLPGIGGGSQVATMAALTKIFDAPAEMAASCAILLWLVCFMAVIPLGLILAHHEQLSLRKLSAESHMAEEAEVGHPQV
jgi:glycosyltransferase 2 family protein